MHYFLYLFSIISLQLSAYKQDGWSSYFQNHQPPSAYGFTLQEALNLKDNSSFEKELKIRLSKLSSTMKTRAETLQTSIHGAALAGFSHALVISLSQFLPFVVKDVTDYEDTSSILGAIDEAKRYFASDYPLSSWPKERALDWFFQKACEIKLNISDKFKTNILEINKPTLPRVIALILTTQIESDEYYFDCLLPLYFEFSGRRMELFNYPSEIFLTEMFATLRHEPLQGSVFLKTNLLGEMIAKTIIKSAGDLSDETVYTLADMLYPASLDFITLFKIWLEKPIDGPEPTVSLAPVKNLSTNSYTNTIFTKPKKDNLIDSNIYFNRVLGENTLKFTEILVANFEQAFDRQISKKLIALLLLLNEAFDFEINYTIINDHKKQAQLLWQDALMSFEGELEEQISKQEENSFLVANDAKIQELKRLFLLELFCTDNHFSEIFSPLVESIEEFLSEDISQKELRAFLKKEQERERFKHDILHQTIIDTFLLYL